MPAHVLLHTLVFAPDGVSTAVLMTELALELRRLGHRVTVLTTTPHYNVDAEARGRQPLERRWGGLLYQSEYQGIRVLHVTIPNKGTRILGRLLDYLRFHAVSVLAGLALTGRYDVVLAPSPPLTIGLSAWILALRRRVPFIYNVQEIYPDIAVNLGMLRDRRVIGVLEAVERFIYARARVVTVISERFRRRLRAKGVALAKVRVIPNFVDTDFIEPLPRQNPFSVAHGLDGRFVVLYAGNIGLTQSLETILDAAARLSALADVRFVIVGDGARRSWVEARLTDGADGNVVLLPYQPRSVIPQMYASSDLCLVPLKRGTAQDTFPSKIYTIMAAARPVVAATDLDSELSWVVSEARCGWTVPPDDPVRLAEAISAAYHERADCRGRGENGRAYVVAHHSRRAIAERYHALVEEITGDV